MTRSPLRSIIVGFFTSIGANVTAYAQTDPYEALDKFITVNPEDTEKGFCIIKAVADFDGYKQYLPLFRDTWLNHDYSIDFYQQRAKQIFVYIVLKRFSEAITEGVYRKDKDRDCTFYVDIVYYDTLGKRQTIHGLSWLFTKQRANQVDWDHIDPKDFMNIAVQYNFSPDISTWIGDEPSMAEKGSQTTSNSCNLSFLRANAIFIRASTYCPKDYLDNDAGYYALAQSKLCAASLSEKELMALTGRAMQELDRVVKQRGKRSACRWVDQIEGEVSNAATDAGAR
jgi:hypothetical protein